MSDTLAAPVTEVEVFDAVYEVPDRNLPRLEWELFKLNKVCTKLNLPLITLTVEKSETRFHCPNDNAPTVKVPYTLHFVRVVGGTPKLSGWTLVATLEHMATGNVVREVPGQTVPELYRDRKCHCDHCKTQRNRKETFVLLHAEHGFKQVGRQCIADFLGHKDPQALAELARFIVTFSSMMGEAEDGDGMWGSGGGSRRETVGTELFLMTTASVVRCFGFVSRKAEQESEGNRTATSGRVWDMMTDFRKEKFETSADRDRRVVGAPTEADVTKAKAAKAWALSLKDKPTKSNYEHNLCLLAGEDHIERKQIGFVASIISSYDRFLEGEPARAERLAAAAEARANRPVSQYVGTPGERRVFTLTIQRVMPIEGYNGQPSNLVFLADAEGNAFKWKTENLPATADGEAQVDKGDTLQMKATIKCHAEYTPKRGDMTPVKQTTILRAVVESVTPATGKVLTNEGAPF